MWPEVGNAALALRRYHTLLRSPRARLKISQVVQTDCPIYFRPSSGLRLHHCFYNSDKPPSPVTSCHTHAPGYLLVFAGPAWEGIPTLWPPRLLVSLSAYPGPSVGLLSGEHTTRMPVDPRNRRVTSWQPGPCKACLSRAFFLPLAAVSPLSKQ